MQDAVEPLAESPRPAWCLSLVLPAWNEEAAIAQAVAEAVDAARRLSAEFEVIVVDDGSTDRTGEIIRALAVADSCIRLIRFEDHRGYGAALRAGFEACRYERVAFTDADCQFDLSDLEHMLPLTERFEIVSGYRIDRKDPPLRRFYSWGYNTLIKALLGSPFRDIDCALKVFRRESLRAILPESNRFFANTEMLIEARLRGLSMVEVGVGHRRRAAGNSTVSVRDIPSTLAALLPYWWRRVQFCGGSTASVERTQPSGIALGLLMLLAGFLLFRGLSYPLIEPDEGRYAEIAREMWAGHDWIVPHFHHEPYLDKPPLFYWLCACSFSLFGPADWAARLVPALAAWLTVALTYWFGCRLVGRGAALFGSLVLTLSVGFICAGRFVMLDSLLALLVSGSLFMAHRAVDSGRVRWGWWLTSAVCCGLGVLTKGPVALVLLIPPMLAHSWLNRQARAMRLFPWMAYVSVVAAIALPWYAAMAHEVPRFVRYFLWEHNVQRFLSGSNHPEPFWYYAPVLFVGCMPWGLLLFPLARSLSTSAERHRQRRTRELGFLVLWAGWGLAFFSASRGKLPAYILPCIPAVMLLVGHYLQTSCSPFAVSVFERAKALVMFRRGTLYLAVAGLLLAPTLWLVNLDNRMGTAVHGGVWLLMLAVATTSRRHQSPIMACAVFCLAAFAAVDKLTHDVVPTWATNRAVLGASRQFIDELKDDSEQTPVACVAGEWGSVPFYLDRDDVAVFPHFNEHEAAGFLREHDAALLVVHRDWASTLLPMLIPNSAHVSDVTTTHKTVILAVQSTDPPVPLVHLLSAETHSRNTRPIIRR